MSEDLAFLMVEKTKGWNTLLCYSNIVNTTCITQACGQRVEMSSLVVCVCVCVCVFRGVQPPADSGLSYHYHSLALRVHLD